MFTIQRFKKYFFILSVLSLLLMASCTPKASGVRATVKSQQTSLNPNVSSQADQQAASAKTSYKINTVSVPNLTDTGYSVDVELTTPNGQFLPFTTNHDNGKLDSEGTYDDTNSGLQVKVQARCSSDNCYKYIVVATVYKTNQAVYQSVAISYAKDCKFHYVSASFNIGEFMKTLDKAENKYKPTPKDDIDTCSN